MYCTNCGKLLQDGEICDCQKQNAPAIQPQVDISPIAEAPTIESTVAPIADVAPIEAAPIMDASFNEAVAKADATIANAGAAADATINGTAQAVNDAATVESQPAVDPIKARIEQQQAENAQAQAAAAAAAAHAQAMAAAQNTNNRANQYYQQYAPQNQAQNAPQGVQFNNQPQAQYSQAPQGQFNQYGQPQAPQGQYTQYGQSQAPQGQYGQPQYNQVQAPQGQYGQAQVPQNRAQSPYGQQVPYGQQNQYQGGNPYANTVNQGPPAYNTQQVYLTDEERLKKYMSNPKFVAARDFMCSFPVLFYALSVSALLIFYVATMNTFWDLLHPLYILLCIGAWITFASGLKSKKNGTLPSTAGLSIGSGVAITMLVLWCIAFGLIIIMLLIAVVSVLSSGVSLDNFGAVLLFVMFIVSILMLVLGIKYYSVQSRNLKNIRYCITNEANPKRFSIFPSVILIIGIILSIVSIIGMQSILGSVKLKNAVTDYLLDYFRKSGIEKFYPGTAREFTDTIVNSIWSTKAQVLSIVASVIGIVEMLAQAVIHISAKSKLNVFKDI